MLTKNSLQPNEHWRPGSRTYDELSQVPTRSVAHLRPQRQRSRHNPLNPLSWRANGLCLSSLLILMSLAAPAYFAAALPLQRPASTHAPTSARMLRPPTSLQRMPTRILAHPPNTATPVTVRVFGLSLNYCFPIHPAPPRRTPPCRPKCYPETGTDHLWPPPRMVFRNIRCRSRVNSTAVISRL